MHHVDVGTQSLGHQRNQSRHIFLLIQPTNNIDDFVHLILVGYYRGQSAELLFEFFPCHRVLGQALAVVDLGLVHGTFFQSDRYR